MTAVLERGEDRFYAATLCVSAVLAVCQCLSVRPSQSYNVSKRLRTVRVTVELGMCLSFDVTHTHIRTVLRLGGG